MGDSSSGPAPTPDPAWGRGAPCTPTRCGCPLGTHSWGLKRPCAHGLGGAPCCTPGRPQWAWLCARPAQLFWESQSTGLKLP